MGDVRPGCGAPTPATAASCHGLNDYLSRKPNFTGIDLGGVSGTAVTNLTWDSIKRLRDTVKVKLVLKGILASEDAKLASRSGHRRHRGFEPRRARGRRRQRHHRGAAGDRRRRSAAACRSWSTAAFAAAAISSRHWRWARRPCVSAGPICGDWAPSASPASSACLESCAPRPATPCSSSARPRFEGSGARDGAAGLSSTPHRSPKEFLPARKFRLPEHALTCNHLVAYYPPWMKSSKRWPTPHGDRCWTGFTPKTVKR